VKLGIIGGGPGGYSAALRASRKGLDISLFEREEIGGVCLNVGCIPTKALITCANVQNSFLKAKRFGLNIEINEPDWEKIQRFKTRATKRIVLGVSNLLGKRGVRVIKEDAKLKDDCMIEAGGKSYEFDRIIIATGSIPNVPKFPVAEGIWNSTDAINAAEIPLALTIIGGGVIGLEFAYIYASFGSDVRVLELEGEVLPGEDRDLSSSLRKNLEKKGIRFYLSSFVKEVKKEDSFKVNFLHDGKEKELKADKVLLSIRRSPFIQTFPKDLLIERGAIKVDKHLRTSLKNVYAIGDCIGGNLLAHAAYKESEVVVRNIIGEDTEINERVVPRVVYTNPELALVGFTEEELQKEGTDFEVARFSFSANGRAIASGGSFGEVKIIYNKKGEILGGGIIGREASELITQVSMAMEYGINVKKLSRLVFPHPTLSEAIKEAVAIANGNPFH